METSSEDTPELAVTDPEMRQLLGLYDVPAFARRGQDLEFLLTRLNDRFARERETMLDMVRLRVRQWTSVAISPSDGRELIAGPIEELIALVMSPPPTWSRSFGTPRKRGVIARDLIASVERFNRRWTRFVSEFPLETFNTRIDDYNNYYLLEKECIFGSARVAARGFQSIRRLTPEGLLEDHPLLPVISAAR